MINREFITVYLAKYLQAGLLVICFLLCSCVKEIDERNLAVENTIRRYQTKNVVIIIVDGLRYSEGWGDSTHQYIPRMAETLARQGVINTRFYNMGATYTSAGHTNITTGVYQLIDNGGKEYPKNPSFFQYWNKAVHSNQNQSWIITSKDKLAVLADCTNESWKGKFTPSVNSGYNGLGLGSGYREDSLTTKTTIDILKKNHPNLVLINFREPDYSGHTGVWNKYISGLRKTDVYVSRLLQFLQDDNIYRNTTTVFITSDHGRHLDHVNGGFAGHGDNCEGCRHLNFFAYGPDFKKGKVVNIKREQIDIAATIGELLGIPFPIGNGKVMTELFGRR